MANEMSPEPPPEGPKKFSLKLRDRLPISTSQGTYFVRQLITSDLPTFSAYSDLTAEPQSQNFPTLGELAVKTFTCLEAKSEKPAPLSDTSYAALSADDIKVLAQGIAEVGGLGKLTDGPVLEALGKVLSNRLRIYAKQAAESTAEIKKAMDRSFGTISDSVKASLADSLSGMAAIRESLRDSTAVAAMRKEVEAQNHLLGQLPKDLFSQIDYAKQFGLSTAADEVLRKIKEDKASLAGLIPKTALGGIEHQSRATQLNAHTLDVPIYRPPPVADTPMGRAAIAGEESARQLREVAGLAGQMTDKIGALSEVMLTKVLPEWFKNLKDGTDLTNQSLVQAEHSVNLAKKAIIWSIGITVAMTIWQLWVAREYKLENDAQQATSEKLLRQQLEASQALNKQMALDSQRLTEEVAKVSQALSNLPVPKASASFADKQRP